MFLRWKRVPTSLRRVGPMVGVYLLKSVERMSTKNHYLSSNLGNYGIKKRYLVTETISINKCVCKRMPLIDN
jgi:hypothetical protein